MAVPSVPQNSLSPPDFGGFNTPRVEKHQKPNKHGGMVTRVTQEEIHFAQDNTMDIIEYTKKRFIGCNVVTSPMYKGRATCFAGCKVVTRL